MGGAPYDRCEKLTFVWANVLSLIVLRYPILLPLKPDSPWLYVEMVVYLFGLIMFLVATGNIATARYLWSSRRLMTST